MKVPTPRKLPSGKYNVQIQVNGKRMSITEGTAKECRNKALLLLTAAQEDMVTISEKSKLPLKKAIQEYIDSRDNIVSPATVRGYQTIMNTRFIAYANEPIGRITNWQKVVNNESKLCSEKTLRNAWGLVKATLKFCEVEIPYVTLPKVPLNEHPFLQPEQIGLFISSAKGMEHELPILLALHGLRRSEVLALEKKDVSGGNIYVHGAVVLGADGEFVKKKTNKTDASARTVPILIPRVEELVKEKKEGRMFDIPPERIRRQIDKICRENGFDMIGFHGLRHSFASLCYHCGLSELETMRLGGWSDPSVMRKIYTHLGEADRNKAADRLRDFFSNPA